MPSLSKQKFLASEEADVLRRELQAMVDSPQYNTETRYSTVSEDKSGFVYKHMEYMSNYPSMNHDQYILNLKVMTKRSK